MGLREFLIYILPIVFLELLAALAGTYYLKTTTSPFRNSKLLVYFLWITVLVEITGSYAPMAYFSDYKFLPFIKETPFENNFWWYNSYILVSFSFFTFYFIDFLKNKTIKFIGYTSIAVFLVASVSMYIVTDSFFQTTSKFVNILGTLLILLSILTFYYELLRSDILLQLKRFLPFYISIGVLVFNLCVTPVEILSEYFNLEGGNELFVKLHINMLLYANIFLYSSFILGFLICSKKKKFSY